ncbi:MAG: glycosyltransferase involved in cell wall biosynthesis [Flavobacteriaceae bacterium]|jgi:glycosyltransferase involved in cell wall biosynthesis
MKISVIICTYNRELYLPKCLEHLKGQTSSCEIILIDNNSTDSTETICSAFIAENPKLDVKYAKETSPGLSHARNRGIDVASGEILCFIDDDGFAIPEYVSIIEQFSKNTDYSNYISFGGKVIPVYNEGKEPKWLSTYIDGLVSKVDLGEEIMPFTKKYPAGCNMIFRKEFFEEHGGFNVDLHTRSDDKFVFDKLKKAGLTTLYIPTLKVQHFIDDYRLEKKFIKRLAKVTGQSEAIRIQEFGTGARLKKIIEYWFKYGASLFIALSFFLRGAPSKAKYVVMVRWNVLIGFFIKKPL